MKIKLTKEEQQKLQAVGLVNVGRQVEVEQFVFNKNYAEWKKTLPLAGHSTLTLKAISTCLWTKRSGEHRKDFVLPSNQPKQEVKVQAKFPRWELRVIIGLLVLILGWLVFALPAKAQFSQLVFIEWKDGGAAINNGFFTYGFTVDCTTNLTCTSDGSTLTLSAAAGSGGRWDQLTAPTGAMSLVSNADAEIMTWDFQSDFSTDRAVFKQTTGNPTGGAVLLVTADDVDALLVQFGASNGVQITQAGALAAIGTGSIAATTAAALAANPTDCAANEFANAIVANGDLTCSAVSASQVGMSRIAGSTFSTAEDMQIVFHSAGWTTGGTINDAGAGNITVDAGTGLVRSTDSSVGTMFWFDWSALGSTAIPADTVRYVGVEYNAGSPQIVVRTTYTWDFNTDFPLGNVVNEGGTLHIENAPHSVGDHANFMVQRMYETAPRKRDDRSGGLIIGETGTRNVTVTAGSVWERLQTFSIAAIDTSVSGGLDTYCTTTKEATAATQWDNANYCNSGTLTALTSNRNVALWFYLELDGALLMVYGNAQYTSQAAAEDDPQPTTVPDRISAQALLIGRMIINEGDATALSIESAFTKAFAAATITDHGELAGLGDDDHTQYGLLAGRSGGQTLIGGTGAGDDLHLQTTSNGSKGTYFLDELTTNGFLKTGGGNGTLSVAAAVAAGEYAAASIDSDDLVAANKQFTISFILDTPTGSDDALLQHKFSQAVTIQRVSCSTDTGTATIQLDERVEATPNTAGTDVMTSTLVCDTDTQATTTFTNAGIAADVPLNLDIEAVASTPGVVRIHIDVQIDG